MKRIFISLVACSLLALLVSLLIFLVNTVELKWAIAAGALGAFSIGLAFNSYLLALRADAGMNEIRLTLGQIKELQMEIQKGLQEQGEKSSGPPIIASLQAVSEYYMDYLKKSRGETGENS